MNQKYDNIVKKCVKQNREFSLWRSSKAYAQFHHNHYDWWAFPINAPSSKGDTYQVLQQDKSYFTSSNEFMNALRENAIMVCEAWGYDLMNGQEIKNCTLSQRWQNWPIRLYKMTISLKLFDQIKLHRNAIAYGLKLLKGNCKFYYQRDLSEHFYEYQKIYSIKVQQKEGNVNKKGGLQLVSTKLVAKMAQRGRSEYKKPIQSYPHTNNNKLSKNPYVGLNKYSII